MFTAREWDAETGLYYYRERYYDSSVGRFLSEDPLFRKIILGKSLFSYLLEEPKEINGYIYALNNPVNRVDPSGLCSGNVCCSKKWHCVAGYSGWFLGIIGAYRGDGNCRCTSSNGPMEYFRFSCYAWGLGLEGTLAGSVGWTVSGAKYGYELYSTSTTFDFSVPVGVIVGVGGGLGGGSAYVDVGIGAGAHVARLTCGFEPY